LEGYVLGVRLVHPFVPLENGAYARFGPIDQSYLGPIDFGGVRPKR
jgi:hypothetical protein